ncbi:ImmA/IrrE family metallo-endopeptidase [Paenibacillus sp. SI8]|uniref:ImmA/IrrE family metallo-endopeptidase n=1 Tax=unclassified Paenibacillus TaxID=185978 RepID=UPI003466A38C
MDLTHYKPTALEELISRHYQQGNIHFPCDLDIEMIADMFGIELHYHDGKSFADWADNNYSYIVIDSRLKIEERRIHFFHEICHPLRHSGIQDKMNKAFLELQEIQAAHFQYYAAMPYYMLSEFQYVSPTLLIKTLAAEFILPEKFVERRLEQVKRRIYIGRQDHEINTRWNTPVKVTMADVRRIMEEFGRRKIEREGSY